MKRTYIVIYPNENSTEAREFDYIAVDRDDPRFVGRGQSINGAIRAAEDERLRAAEHAWNMRGSGSGAVVEVHTTEKKQ